MGSPLQEFFFEAIAENDLDSVKYCLENGASVNRTCSAGITPLGAAALSGNFQIFQLLAESTRKVKDVKIDTPLILHPDMPKKKCKNIGYFVVRKEMVELGEGPTPDGMEALEWDVEISDDTSEIDGRATAEFDIYQWYAKILNQSSVILKSPDGDIAHVDKHGQNSLHYAIRAGNIEMVEYLVKSFPELSVNQANKECSSPLHLAVIKGNKDIITFLIEQGANVNATNANRETPLHLATARNDSDLVNFLIEKNANVNICDRQDRSPLCIAVLNCNETIVKVLIKNGTRLNHEEAFGFTVLYRAVWNNSVNITRQLLEAGAKVVKSHYLLHVAAMNNNLDIIKMLHRAGSILNIRDEEGSTPLMMACKYQNLPIARYLLQNGVPVNTANSTNGMTALHICVQEIQDPALFQQFLEVLNFFKADLNANSYLGNVLFYAIITDNLNGACELVRYGVDVNLKDENAFFDNLSLAKKHGNLELVRLIVHAGFNVNNMLFDFKSLKNGDVDHVYDYLAHVKSNPLDLRDLCRIRIRKKLGKNLMLKISQLPLPAMLLKYLALEIC